MTNIPKIGIIGCGAISESFFLPAIAKHPAICKELVLIDTNESRLKELSSKFNIEKISTNYQQLIGNIDGVIIATPNYLHFPLTMSFLKEGIHVLCEKPLAETGAEAREMVALAKKKGLHLAVNNTRRLFPSNQKIKKWVSEGFIGNLVSIQYFEGSPFNWPTASGFYFNSKKSHRGVLMDRGAHVFDLICWWLGGKPKLISSKNDSYGGPEAVAFINFQHDECKGEAKFSWLSKFQNNYRVEGTNGVIYGNISDWRTVTIQPLSNKPKKIKLKTKINRYPDFGDELITNYINVLNKNAKPLVSAEEIIDSIAFLEECYASASRFDMPWNGALEK